MTQETENYPTEIGICKFNDGTFEVYPHSADIPPSVKYIRADTVPEDPTKAGLIEALEKIAVYDLYDCSAVEDTDFEQNAKTMYEIAKEALEKAKGDR